MEITCVDLEEQVNACWMVIDDIKLLNQTLQNTPGALTDDQVANYLLGLETIYALKFNQLQNTISQLIQQGTLK